MLYERDRHTVPMKSNEICINFPEAITANPVADLRGAQGTPHRVQILSISCSFWENLAKSYVGVPPPRRVGAPSSGKSWIRHWNPQKLVNGGSRISQRRVTPTCYLAKFTKNCMKMKKSGPREGGMGTRPKFVCVDPPLVVLMWMRIPVADSPTDQNFLNFIQFFANLYAGVPLLEG